MTRTRSTSSSDSPIQCSIQSYGAGHTNWDNPIILNASAPTYTSCVPYSYEKTMTDEITPNWNRVRNSGRIIENPMSSVETRWFRTPVVMDCARLARAKFTKSGFPDRYGIDSYGWTWSGTQTPENTLGTAFLSAPSLSLNVQDIAVTGSWAKANEQDVMGLVILAEGEKTIKSFTSIGYRFLKTLRALRRWDAKWLAKQLTPKELSERWMEGRYAIRPCVYDALDCVKAARRNLTQNPVRRTYKSGAMDSSTSVQNGVVIASSPNDWRVFADKTTTRVLSARAGVLAAIEEVTAATSWGLNQPFTALWELVPYSFVVDWFFNVGKTIAAWSPSYGIRSLASWVTVNDTVTSSIAISGCADDWNHDIGYGYYDKRFSYTKGSIVKIVTSKYRLVNPDRPILPSYNVQLNWTKFLDLGIMAKQLLR